MTTYTETTEPTDDQIDAAILAALADAGGDATRWTDHYHDRSRGAT